MVRSDESVPIREWPEWLAVCGSIPVQQGAQRVARFAEHDEALPLHQLPIAFAEGRSEFDKMRYRRIGIFIAFVHKDRLPVGADEPLIRQYAILGLRRGGPFRR